MVSQAFFNINTTTFVTTVQPIVEGPATDATCSDGLDNDGDGLVDMQDPDCQATAGSVGGIAELRVQAAGPTDSNGFTYALAAGAGLILAGGLWYGRGRRRGQG